MRTIFVYLALLTSFLGFSQTPLPNEEIQYSPGGKFEKLYDHYGNEYRLKDLKIDTVSQTNKSVSFPNECNSGYFKLYYDDGSGFEIQGNSVHQQRRAVLCQLFYDLSQFIIPADPNTSVNIWVKNINDIFPSGTNLPAGAATGLYSIPSNTTLTLGGIIENQIWKTINSGVDAYTNVGASFLNENQSFGNSSPTYYHGIITFDFTNVNWNTNLSVSPSSIQHDLYSVALHEITHALGFASLIGIDGSSKLGSPYYTRYDTHLKAFGTDPLITTNATCGQSFDYGFNSALSSSVLAPSTVNCNVNNSIFFVGQSVNQPVYLSSSFSNGSSLSHFEDLCHLSNMDNSNGSYPDNLYYVMSDQQGIGAVSMKRYLKVEEKNTLCEIGYNLNNSFGDITNANLNYIAYPSSICSNSSVVGVNDGIGTNSEYTFVINPTESYTFNYNDFLNNDYPSQSNNLTFECAESVYGLGTINLISPNSFEYTAISNTNGIDIIRYIPIGPNGDRGSITYIYVYVPDGTCVPNACNNYISNGDFENSTGCEAFQSNFSQNAPANVSCWNSVTQTADLYSRDCNDPWGNNTITSNGAYQTWNENNQIVPNNHFVSVAGVYLFEAELPYVETIQNKLNQPLLPNENYVLSFRVRTIDKPYEVPVPLLITGSEFINTSSTSWITSTPSNLSVLHQEIIIPSNDWTFYEIQIPNGTFNTELNYLTIIPAIYLNSNFSQISNYSLTGSIMFLDDISIVKAIDHISFIPPLSLCNSSSIDLQNYVNIPNGAFSGPGVSGTSFDPSIAGVGTHEITYTFTDNINCVTSISAHISVHDANTTPTFTQLPSYCVGQTPATLPNTSNNNIVGTWNPLAITTSTFGTNTYTFTPSGECGTQTTMTISILSDPIVPTFTQRAPICSGSISSALPTTSINGITGTWTPAFNNMETTTYTFTPTFGQCATSATMTITVIPLPIASISAGDLISNCEGSSVQLTTLYNASYSYQWQQNGTNISGATSSSYSAPTSGSYTVVVTSNNCLSTSNAVIVTVNPTITPTITPTFTQLPNYCVGQTPANLPNQSNNSILGSWDPQVISTSTSGNTTYTFTPTPGQCANPTTMNVTVNPVPTATIAGTNTICSGQSTTLTASGGGTYAWSTGATTASITVSPTTTTTYTATVTLNGCTSTASRVVTVNSLPTATISGTNTICSGQSTTLTASGGGTYAWSTGATTASITVTPATTTTYTATVTLNGCTSTASRVVTVNSLPTATISGTNTICSGQSTTLTASGGGTYTWSTGPTTALITVTPATTTTYTASVTLNGCTSTASRVVTVNPLPTATISGTNTICSGQSTTLTALGGGTYAWSTGATTASITVSPTTTNTYTVTVTSNGCSSTASKTITVNTTTASISVTENSGIAPNDGIVCVGATVTLGASGGGTYVWSNSAGSNSSITFTATSNLTRTVTVTLNGCTAIASKTITVNSIPPTFTISPTETSGLTNNDGTICVGAFASLTTSVSTPIPTWSTGATGQSITVSPLTNTTYTATITNANGCQRIVQRPINVKPLPVFSITNTNPVICSGTSSTLTVSPSTSLTNFTWSPGTLPTTSSITVTPTTTTIYTVTAKNTTTGCSNSASTTITINSVSNNACCTPPSIPPFNNAINTSAMVAISPGSIIQVNANIIVDQNRTFTGCSLRLAKDVKIIVNSGKVLTLNNCKLYSCTEMWDGIYVGSGAQVIVSNSRIEDALNAINSTDNGDYKVTNSFFNKNNIGIKVSAFTTHLGEVSGTTFEGTATNSLDPSTATLKNPMFGQKAHFGVFVEGGGNITIGKVAAPYNYFQNIETGIYVNNVAGVYTPNFSGTVKIYRNNFQNITQTACLGSNCDVYNPEGWPIWTYFTYTVIGDNLGLNYENKFTNCSNGIQLINSRKFSILKNSFTNIVTPGFIDFIDSKSIYILGSTAPSALNTGDISSNTFNNFEYGIYYLGNKQQNLKIEKNELNNFNAKEKHTAIWLLEQQTFNINIQNNIINKPTNLFGSRGILIQNATINPEETSILVQKNSIKNTKNGIWITNMNNVEIRDQHSDYFADDALTTKAGIYFNTSIPVPITTGIKLEGANNTKVIHNTIQRIDYATGGISSFSEMGMADAARMYGITVGENCANSDIIDNTTLKMGTGIYVFGNNNNPSTLKCNFMKFHPIGLHINGIIGQQGTETSPQDNQWAIVTPGSLGIKREGSLPPSSYTFYMRSTSMPFLPNPLTQMLPASAIDYPTTIISNPVYSCQEGCANPPCLLPAGLMQVITSTGEYGVLTEEELKVLDIELYKSLKISPYNYDAATEEGLKYQEFIDSMDMTNAYKIYDLEKELALKDTLAAQQKLAAFEAFGDVELNYKKVFEVYINNWMKGKYYLAKQDSIKLKEIAFQSPRVAGNSVYMARVMLSIDTIDTETYSAKSMRPSNAVVNDQLKLFPNPGSEYIHYQLPILENETGWVKIIDVSGKIVDHWKVDSQNTIGSINVSHYSKGIYMFELELMNGKSIVKKLVVE